MSFFPFPIKSNALRIFCFILFTKISVFSSSLPTLPKPYSFTNIFAKNNPFFLFIANNHTQHERFHNLRNTWYLSCWNEVTDDNLYSAFNISFYSLSQYVSVKTGENGFFIFHDEYYICIERCNNLNIIIWKHACHLIGLYFFSLLFIFHLHTSVTEVWCQKAIQQDAAATHSVSGRVTH